MVQFKLVVTGGEEKQRSRRWPKILLGLGGLLAAGWLFVSSGFFLERFVLPKAGAALGGELTADAANWSPLSSIRLARFRFVADGQTKPLIAGEELRVEYDLFAILGGTITLGRLELDRPMLRLVKSADGETSIDPILRKLNSLPDNPASGAATRLDIRAVTVKNADLVMTTDLADGQQDKLRIRLASFSVDRLANGSPTTLNISGAVTISRPASGTLAANGTLNSTIQLDNGLGITRADSVLELSLSKGTRLYQPFNGSTLTANLDAALPEIRNLDLAIERDGARLVEANVSGQLNPETLESDLAVRAMFQGGEWLLPLPGLAPAQLHVATQASLDARFKASSGGNVIEASGKLKGADTSLLADWAPKTGSPKTGKTTGLNLELDFAARADLAAQTATLDELEFTAGKSGGQPLSLTLNKPMFLALGGSAVTGADSSLALRVDQLNLADWPSFAGQFVRSGIVTGTLNLDIANGGKSLDVRLNSTVEEITLTDADPKFADTRLDLDVIGKLDNWETVSADKLHFALGRGETTWATFDGSVAGALGQLRAKGRGEFNLPVTASLAAVPGLDFEAGSMSYTVTLGQAGNQLSVDTTAAVTGFTGGYADWKLVDWNIALNSRATIGDEVATLEKTTLTLIRRDRPQGKLELNGTLPLGLAAARLNITATGVLAETLNALAKPWLAPVQVTRGRTETSATIDFGPDGSIAADINGSLDQLMLAEGSTPMLAQPVTLGMAVKTKLNGDSIELASAGITLPKSARAENRLTVSGKLTAPAGGNTTGSLKLASNELDLTALSKLLPAASAAESTPKAESDFAANLASLPGRLSGLALELQVELAKAFWEELTITKAHILGKTSGEVIDLHKVEFELNGLPVIGKMRIDKSTPKPLYALEVNMKELPAQPLVDTFDPDAKGTLAGKLTLLTKLNSSGTTEAEFWKNLGGSAELKFAEGDLRLLSDTTKILLSPVAILLRLPQLLNSPIDSMHVTLKIADRVVQVEKCEVRGTVFKATTRGEVPLGKTFSDSRLDLPVEFSLKRDLADKAGLIPGGTPLSAKFVKLPDFVTIRGSIGQPKTKTNKLALLAIFGQSAVSLPGAVENQTGNLLENAAGILSGEIIGTDLGDALGNRGKGLFKDLNRIVGGEDAGEKKKEQPVNPLQIFGPLFSPENKSNKGGKPKK